MKTETAKWLPVTRHIADAVPAAVLRQILEHERRMMPAGMRAHLDELMREAEKWRERQSRPAGVAAEPTPAPADEQKAEGIGDDQRHQAEKINAMEEPKDQAPAGAARPA